jgi:hypothetical protein
MEDPKGGEITPSSFHVLTSCKDATAPTEHCWKITALQSVEKHQKLMKAEGTAIEPAHQERSRLGCGHEHGNWPQDHREKVNQLINLHSP